MSRLTDPRTPLSVLVAAVAAILAAAILVIGIAGLAVGAPGLTDWLALLFAINFGWSGITLASLHAVRPIDIALLVLTAVAFSGVWPGTGRPHKVWMGLAIALPLAGIVVLVATEQAGRSGLMAGGLVLSFLMLGDRRWRALGLLGVAANALLLTGDFATGGSAAPVAASAVGVGYLLLVAWFGWMAARLLNP